MKKDEKKILDCDKLPYKIKGKERCQILDDEGSRCRRKARYAVQIFEKREFGGRWFGVNICKNHVSGDFAEFDQIRQLEEAP